MTGWLAITVVFAIIYSLIVDRLEYGDWLWTRKK